MKKYEFTGETKEFFGIVLHRIRALVHIEPRFGFVINPGDLGGWIEKEENLSHDGNAWVCGNAKVYGDAAIYGNAAIHGNAKVYGDAKVCGDAKVYGDAWVCGNAKVYGNAAIYGNAEIKRKEHIMTVSNIGSRNDTTTFFRTKTDVINVKCGCFRGTIDEFESKVVETYGNNKHAKVYKAAAKLARMQIELEGDEENAED